MTVSNRGGRMRSTRPAVFAALLVMTVAPPLAARAGVIDQVWVGGFAHDVSDLDHGKESGTGDIQIEIDSTRPALLRVLGSPRINGVLSLNSAGLSNYGGVGLTWDHRLISRLRGSIDLGMALTDGVSTPPAGPGGAYERSHRLLLGSKVLFRTAAGLDWPLSDRWSIGAEFVHLSNGLILGHRYNQGINDAGIRFGCRF